jgi:hypothetical protein
MHYPLSAYQYNAMHKYGYGSLEEAVDDVGQKAESLMVQAKQQAEEAGSAVVHTMEDATTRQRQRQAVYMVAAPLIIFSGITNKRYKTLGMASAVVGALIGFRSYTEYKNVEDLRNQVGLK